MGQLLSLIWSMAGGMVGRMAVPHLGNDKRSSEPGSNPNANSSSGSSGDKSGPPGKISGTSDSFIVKGHGSEIDAQDAHISSGCGSGSANAKMAPPQGHDPSEECSGTNQSFKVESGGRLNIAKARISSGAGASIPQEVSPQNGANPVVIVPLSQYSSKGRHTAAHEVDPNRTTE